ncbi:hypothetical protein ZWY2020_038885 [Hordeum vulgare]|nr:hypothetical protein ZWY2020_038885 [Hordeum vulgare]
MDEEWKNKLWKTCVYAITLGMLVALLLGLNMSWSAITAALALIVLDFKDAHPCLEKCPLCLCIRQCWVGRGCNAVQAVSCTYYGMATKK